MQLRPYQIEMIDDTRVAMKAGNKRICLTLPTGGGKTALMAHMMATAAAKGMRSWFVVHRRELLKQSVAAFEAIGLSPGIISAGFRPTPQAMVQVCAIGSLKNRYRKQAAPTLIAWDECHHVAAKSWQQIFNHFSGSFHVGLTATPCRLDGKGLGDYFQTLIEGPSVSELIEMGFLADYKLYAPGNLDTTGLKKRMGDYIRTDINELMNKPTITGSAIKEYERRAHGKRAIVFAVSIEHSKEIVEQFRARGITAEHIDGGVDRGYRDRAIDRFRSGETKVLSNVDLVGEGFDLPAIECAILLRPTQSLGLYLQQVGRALRPSPGKRDAIILDHANNARLHGLPDTQRQWTLLGSQRVDKSTSPDVKVKICEKCFAAQPPGSTACKFCGYLFPLKPRVVAEVEGDLVELSEQEQKVNRREEQSRAVTFDELVALGERRGYKRPRLWAKHIMVSRGNTWNMKKN
jgi:superfamily II DNA or RNA helicase